MGGFGRFVFRGRYKLALGVSRLPCRLFRVAVVFVWGLLGSGVFVHTYIYIHANVLGRDPCQWPRAKAQEAKCPKTAWLPDQRPPHGGGVVTGAGRQLHIHLPCHRSPSVRGLSFFGEYIVVFVCLS